MNLRVLLPLILAGLLHASCGIAPTRGAGERWEVLQNSVGVSAMHMQLLHNDRVILFDRTNFGESNLTFPPQHPCRVNPLDKVLPKGDCTAHSVEYDVKSNTFRALSIFTDTWCSSGYVAPDGTLVQTGGSDDGIRKVRQMPACNGGDMSCDWSEKPNDPDVLSSGRWYATNQKLPDGHAIIVGGLSESTYEFYPKPTTGNSASFKLPFLGEASSLYPFVHLNIDGNLFIFSNYQAILFDYNNGNIVRTYPTLGTGNELRTYPYAGSSVLLPLLPNPTEAEVLVCGGALASATDAVWNKGIYPPSLVTCGRLKITDPEASWAIETMPSPRVMGDMILLPNGEVVILNGAKDGFSGWDSSKTPARAPFIYQPNSPAGSRFTEQIPAGTARLYHSTAVLLRDGRVLVGGSNPHQGYVFSNVEFPTELGLDAFSPDYLDSSSGMRRPNIILPSPRGMPVSVSYGQQLVLLFQASVLDPVVSVTMVAPSFTTHTFAQNQRLLFLKIQVMSVQCGFEASVEMPTTAVLAPPGYYMLFVVNGRIPSEGIWLHIQ